jgi:diguanylate cyclase (GGDEF)-like protein
MKKQASAENQAGTITPKILGEQIRFAFDVFPITITVLLIAISLMAYLVWQHVDASRGGYWYAAALIVIGIRIALYFIYKVSDKEHQTAVWRYAFLLGALASALLIGFAAIVFFNNLPDAEKMVFTVLALGIVSGVLPELSINLKSYAIYVLLGLVPLALMNLASPAISLKLVGAILFVFAGMLIVASFLFNRALLDSLTYRYHSEFLSDRLQVTNNRLSTANNELQKVSIIDEPTGVFSQRFFSQRFEEVWADHSRQHQSLAALVVGIDHFSDYINFFGHLQGDQCLKRIAGEIAGVVHRPRDFVARFSDEKFIVLLPTTDLIGAKGIASHIHDCIKQLAIPHKVKGDVNRVTVSIGGATMQPSNDYNPETFLDRANKALLQAKHLEGNKTVFM